MLHRATNLGIVALSYGSSSNAVVELFIFLIMIIISLMGSIGRSSRRRPAPRSGGSTTYTTAAGPRRVCGTCGSVMMLTSSQFCPICGAPLTLAFPAADLGSSEPEIPEATERQVSLQPAEAKALPPAARIKATRGRTCMVCELPLEPGDTLAYCPHCGNPAHKVHLLEWLHVKNYCPMCHEHLGEMELKQQMERAKDSSARMNAPRRKLNRTGKGAGA